MIQAQGLLTASTIATNTTGQSAPPVSPQTRTNLTAEMEQAHEAHEQSHQPEDSESSNSTGAQSADVKIKKDMARELARKASEHYGALTGNDVPQEKVDEFAKLIFDDTFQLPSAFNTRHKSLGYYITLFIVWMSNPEESPRVHHPRGNRTC